MVLNELHLRGFRNYDELRIDFSPESNFFIGDNGQGKTNLLESIYCLGLVKSFRTAKDSDLVQFGKDGFEISGTFINELSVKHSVSVVYQGNRKAISCDKKRLQRHSSLIGFAPMVLFSPEDHRITGGGPVERRHFIDLLLSQANRKYLKNLQEYTRILRQRNKLIALIAEGEADPGQLDSWDAAFVTTGYEVLQLRLHFIEEVAKLLAEVYREISGSRSTLATQYLFSEDVALDTVSRFGNTLERFKRRDLARRQTLIGPHRDDIQFTIDGRDVKKHASRGEQKSVLLALKIVEYLFLQQKKQTTPIFLLDDLHSELDEHRQLSLFGRIAKLGQAFITMTGEPQTMTPAQRVFHIRQGQLEPIAGAAL